MTAMTRPPKQLTDWLEEMVLAHWRDVRAISLEALAQGGMEMQLARCDVHPNTGSMRLSGIVRHLIDTEGPHERDHPGEPRLHLPGDIRPADPLEQLRAGQTWERSNCRSCGRAVIWAHTKAGKKMPVDAVPDPAGALYLVPWPNDPIEPMVMGIREPEAETSGIDPAQLRTSHFATCPDASGWRRKR